MLPNVMGTDYEIIKITIHFIIKKNEEKITKAEFFHRHTVRVNWKYFSYYQLKAQ